jgi:hypothetical protein
MPTMKGFFCYVLFLVGLGFELIHGLVLTT